MDAMIWIFGGAILILAFGIFYKFIYPDMQKKPAMGYRPTPNMRPAKSFILDDCKYNFGWGEIVGRTVLSPYKTAFRIDTAEGTYNVPYYRWEIKPLNIFDTIAGEGHQTFSVRNSSFNLEKEELEDDLRQLKTSLKKTREESDFNNQQRVLMQNNITKETSDRMDLILESKRASQKPQGDNNAQS